MPPAGLPERIWKTDDLQRLDDLLSARNGRSVLERAEYLHDLQALDYLEGQETLGKKYKGQLPSN